MKETDKAQTAQADHRHEASDADASPAPVRHIPFTSLPLPSAFSQRIDRAQHAMQQQRQKTLESTPAFIVNNSTNIIGGMDILAEMMVFKATGSNLVSPQNRGKPLHYLIDPPRNLYRSVAARASFDVSAKDLLDPKFYKQSIAEFTDLEKASARELRRGRLINRWQARAMFCSLMGMTVSAIVPVKRDDPNETFRMGQLWQDRPMGYVGTRFRQALWPPGWGDHKTQFAGLAKTVTGVFSFLSSYRNVAEGKHYFHNPAHGMSSVITTAGGLQLMMGIDKEQSWQNYGATSWLRLGFLPFSIYKRFYERDRRAVWYAGSVAMFQLENTFAYFVGGAEKDAYGNIVDKKSLREQATKAAKPLFDQAPETNIQTPADAPLKLSAQSTHHIKAA